jgi:deoxycytidine triphosphate deaminase
MTNSFAQDDNEARQKFESYKSRDPFPGIVPALLNSADIYDYVATTGMIYPFDPQKLKSASYSVPIRGKAVYWDENNQKVIEYIDNGYEFELRPNSIAFVTLEPMLRLPDYIAFRFNLKITNVYRGILLGTGPLVDPGFTGKLSIPLHNLTTNNYKFKDGEDLIWMEFTKISVNELWDTTNIDSNSLPTRTGRYIEFPLGKALPDVEDYLGKADKHRSIKSSIPEAFRNSEKAAMEASNTVKFFQRAITIGGSITALVVFISLGALYFQVNSLVQDSVNYVNSVKKDLNNIPQDTSSSKKLEEKIRLLEAENKKLNQINLDFDKVIKETQKK